MNFTIMRASKLASASLLGIFLVSASVSAQETNRLPNTPLSPAELNGNSLEFISSPDFAPDAPAVEVLSDNSFELGTPNPVWTESSTNFGTPLCSIAACGTGTGTGPRTGDWWAWFGGIGTVEVGEISQQVVIPLGTSALLTFYLEAIVCSSPSDFLEVKIDGNQVYRIDGSSTLCGNLGYSLVSIPIDSYADGGNHTLVFYSEAGAAGSGTNFFVDDVSIEVDGPTALDNRATFKVTKFFADGNDKDEVTVTLDCNTGVILDQDKDLADGESVTFVVTGFDAGELNCSVSEDGLAGYAGEYYEVTSDSSGANACKYTAVDNGDSFECEITNSPLPVEIEVTKDWVISGNQAPDLDTFIVIAVACTSEIVGTDCSTLGPASGPPYGPESVLGEGGPDYDSFTACVGETGLNDVQMMVSVIPGYPESRCIVEELFFDSSIESANGCGEFGIKVGQGQSCTITNTVFYEGIPTLSQYGMATLALLMLGLGMIGFRRYS